MKLRDLWEERNLKKLLWVLLFLNMAAIFVLSATPADMSTVESDAIVALPKSVFDLANPELADDEAIFKMFQVAVRKTAHFLEFATLSVWAAGLLALYRMRFPYLLGGAFSILYAVSDELHQTFVPGREGKITDWAIDALGAIFGVLLLWTILSLRKRNEAKMI